ncbi:hypothetical protein ACFRH6_14050 [Streptomyces sp. NPDC056749]|uniref:hypothetical protein n=1 Tax=Streptomyces sp. NPDC056749 TaxID=3345936 RepID=UPI003695F7C2
MSGRGMTASARAGVALSLTALVAGAVLWGSGAAEGEAAVHRDTQAERIMSGREVFDFDTVAEMASTSLAVVQAEVVQVAPGRSLGSEEEGGVDQARDVTLSVTASFKRPLVAAPSTIVMEEWGWDEDGHGYQVENVTWSEVGDKGFYFLTRSDAASRWQLVSTQGRALTDAQGALQSSAAPGSPLHSEIGSNHRDILAYELKRLLDTKNPAPDLPQPHAEPEIVPDADLEKPAPEDGAEEPMPDDSVDDGSEPVDGTEG